MLAYQTRRARASRSCRSTTVDRIIAIGSDRMMAAVKAARHGVLAPYLKPDHVGIASINSPMQCMMKEVCAQCLQKHVDPVTGKETIIFSCFNQDQELDRVDFPNLAARLRQNTVQEKLASMWLDHLLQGQDFPVTSCDEQHVALSRVDVPAIVAERVHQLGGSFDQLAGLFHFLDGF